MRNTILKVGNTIYLKTSDLNGYVNFESKRVDNDPMTENKECSERWYIVDQNQKIQLEKENLYKVAVKKIRYSETSECVIIEIIVKVMSRVLSMSKKKNCIENSCLKKDKNNGDKKPIEEEMKMSFFLDLFNWSSIDGEKKLYYLPEKTNTS